jgi:hypothetical protein
MALMNVVFVLVALPVAQDIGGRFLSLGAPSKLHNLARELKFVILQFAG